MNAPKPGVAEVSAWMAEGCAVDSRLHGTDWVHVPVGLDAEQVLADELALTLCVNCGNHGSTGTGRDRKPCLECEYGREIAGYLEQFRAERKTLETARTEPYGTCFVHGEEWDEGGSCGECAGERRESHVPAAEDWTGACPS